MDNQHDDTRLSESNIRILSSLIVELNITRRNFTSYPKGHPLITSSLNKVIEIYNRFLLQDDEVTIAVARNSLMVKGVLLDKNNIIFRDFAKVLFEHGIGALTLCRGLTVEELIQFNEIICLKREELLNRGGISELWENAAISSLKMQPIRYDLFHVVDAPVPSADSSQPMSQSLWERFARSLIQDSLSKRFATPGDDGRVARDSRGSAEGGGIHSTGDIPVSDDEIDPRLLASILNRQLGSQLSSTDVRDNESSTVADKGDIGTGAMTTFGELIQDVKGTETEMAIPYEKLALFISSLNPELRRQFLSSSFDVSAISDCSMAEDIIPHLSLEAIAETLEDVRQNRFVVQSSTLDLLEKLAYNATPQQNASLEGPQGVAEIQQKIRSIFREHSSEEFVPESYQRKLDHIITSEHGLRIDRNEIIDLLDTFDDHFVENQISDIIVRIMILENDPEQTALLINNLRDMFCYMLSTGDYDQLINLINQCHAPELPPEIRERLYQSYISPDSLNEMLVGLTTWGKSKYDDITCLINTIGEPFIEVLLDRLTEEETLSLRRFLMDRIQEFGLQARGALLARLSDKRWFVLRNLIIMLRQLDDSTILEHIRPLMSNPHPRVRQEALRTCLYFRDPTAERQVLYDMDSPDREVQLSAINLAEKSRSTDVFKKLLAIIGRAGFSGIECELKSAAITSLAEIGKVEALPELARLLASKRFLSSRALTKLKIDAIRSMVHYPSTLVQPILTRVAAGSGDIARQAQLTLKMISDKTP
ncbi:MAG: HEAT repeat domain-containing protein [Desulfuromonadales bacterium]|nr:HEAT repeat domain-containing protein [Desulfuromonadales bacterium]